MESKEFKELVRNHHALIINHVCMEKGMEALFGDANILNVEEAIAAKGAEQIVKETTWSFAPSTADGYDAWVMNKVKWDMMPKYVSKDMYLEAFKPLLTALFQQDRREEENREKA